MLDLFATLPYEQRPTVIAPEVGDSFEFGTSAYRSAEYAAAVLAGVPAGVPMIVSNDAATWEAGARISARNPLIGVLHGDDAGYDRLVLRFGKFAGAIACVSNRVNHRTTALDRQGQAPVVKIACGIPLKPIPTARSADGAGPLRLAWAGRMDEDQKRVSDLPKIAARLRDRGVAFSLDLMGDGPASESLHRAIVELALQDIVRVHAWGSTTQVLDLLARSDLLLLPSNSEGMPITVMEALSMGCGIVTSRVSGVEDYESHRCAKSCLWIHGIGDVDGAAERICTAARVPSGERIDAARALAEDEFSIDVCADRYAALLERLAPTRSMGIGSPAMRRSISKLISYPVAAQRIARLYAAGRYQRPTPPASLAQPSTL